MVSIKLGLTSFGGPVAHLGYFREAYVVKHGWLSEERFSELLALCQFIPGPASSQLGALIGYEKGGWFGALGSWLGFTLPSAIIMILLAIGIEPISNVFGVGWIKGLKLAAVAIIALAVIGMYKKLCPTLAHFFIAFGAFFLLLIGDSGWLQPIVILLGGIAGINLFCNKSKTPEKVINKRQFRLPWTSAVSILLLIVCLFVLPTFSGLETGGTAIVGLLSAGGMVFGGGHVVLPLLEARFVQNGLLDQTTFLAGYGAAQAIPGPMFTLSSYLGAALSIGGNPILGGFIGTLALFTPGMLLLIIGVPIWNYIKELPRMNALITGANAAVVGLMAAALVYVFRMGAVDSINDWLVILPVFLVMGTRKLPAWITVLLAGILGAVIF